MCHITEHFKLFWQIYLCDLWLFFGPGSHIHILPTYNICILYTYTYFLSSIIIFFNDEDSHTAELYIFFSPFLEICRLMWSYYISLCSVCLSNSIAIYSPFWSLDSLCSLKCLRKVSTLINRYIFEMTAPVPNCYTGTFFWQCYKLYIYKPKDHMCHRNK